MALHPLSEWEPDADERWRGADWLPDWPEEAYLMGEYGLFLRDAHLEDD